MATFVLYHGVRYDPEIEAHCLASVCQSRKYAVEAAIVNGLRLRQSSVDGKAERLSMGLRSLTEQEINMVYQAREGWKRHPFASPAAKDIAYSPTRASGSILLR